MNEVWQAAGVVGALPPDFLTSAEANEALKAVRVKCAVASDPSAFRRPLPTELGSERLMDLGQRLAPWTARYDADATTALQTVNPRTALNLAYFGAAVSRLRGRPAPHEVTMRRWIWIVAAAGGGHGTPGSGLHPFIQAAQDWRNLSLIRSFLSPTDMWGVEDLTAMDQGLLLGARSHVAWGAAQVAAYIADLSDGTVPSQSLRALLSSVHRVASEPGWMQGNPAPMPDSARTVAERMSVDAGAYASAEFSALNAARTAALKPFVQFDEALLPANLEGATVDIHVPVLDLARSARTSNESAALMEHVCARVLEQCPGLTTRVGDVYLHSTATEETAEVDVFASDRASRHFLDAEVKAHYEDRDIPTTPKLYKAGFRGSLSQLAERRRVFLGGAYATVRGERQALSPRASFVGLAVLLHDYSGLIWRPQVLGEQRDANLLTMADLAVITSTLRDDDEFFEYLEYRELLFGRGSGFAHDEVDVLCHFLESDSTALRRHLREMPERTAYMVPAREMPSSLTTHMHPPPREEFRRQLLTLPRV